MQDVELPEQSATLDTELVLLSLLRRCNCLRAPVFEPAVVPDARAVTGLRA